MQQVTVRLPDELVAYLAEPGRDTQRIVVETLALAAYRENKISTAQLRRVLGFDTRGEVHAFLKEHGVFLHYGLEELRHDREAGDALLTPPTA